MSEGTRFLPAEAAVAGRALLFDARRRVEGPDFVGRVRSAADDLARAGAAPGTMWGWTGDPTVEGLVELHAILETGATLVPLNPALGEEALRRAHQLLPLSGSSLIEDGRVIRRPVDRPADARRVAALHADAADPLALVWTSGSTGDPRAVVLTESAIRWHVRMVETRLALDPEDRWAATLSPAHVGGLLLVLRAAALGCGVRALDGFDAGELVRAIEEEGVTHASLVPTMLDRVLDHLARRGEGGSRLKGTPRAVLIGGAHAPPALLSRAAAVGVPVAATWGMSEMSSQVVTATPEETAAHPDAVGRPLHGIDLRVARDGELHLRGPTLAAGRFAVTPDSVTAEPLLSGGWFASGDLGSIDADGRIRVTGRKGLRIISGGVNVDPLEVEAGLRALDGIAAAIVVGIPDPEWGERVCALVVERPAAAAPVLRPALIEAARRALTGARLPRLIVSVPHLPLNANGKADRSRAAVILEAHRREPLDP